MGTVVYKQMDVIVAEKGSIVNQTAIENAVKETGSVPIFIEYKPLSGSRPLVNLFPYQTKEGE